MIIKLNRKFVCITLICLCILFTVLLAFYPGLVSYDGNSQWQQVQSRIITDAHPFFSTFFMLLLSKIWNSITVVVVYQILLVSITWAYLCKIIKLENKKQTILMYIFTIIVMLLPLTCLFSITVWKDIIYTSYLFLCAILLFEWSENKYAFSARKYCLLGLMIAMVFSYRHNGIIVSLLLLVIIYFITIRKYIKKEMQKINFRKCFCILGTFIIIITIISVPKKIILEDSRKKLNNASRNEVSYSTIDSYMLWMMGAHIKDKNINNNTDKNFLNNIIPLKEWKKAYNPYLINNTGLTPNLNKEFLVKNSSKFEKLFLKYSFSNPLTIFIHYLKADSLLIDPFASFHGYVYVYCFPEMWMLPDYTVIRPKFKLVNNIYNKIVGYSLKKPFIMFYQPAFILYLSLIITFVLAKRVYGKRIWLFSLPMILNIISLLPINLAQDLRYVYINYWTFYGLLLLFIINYKKIFKRKRA